MMYETRYFWHCGKLVQTADKQARDEVYRILAKIGPYLKDHGYTAQMAARVAVTCLHNILYPDMEAAFSAPDNGVRFIGEVDPEAIGIALDLGLIQPTTEGEKI